MLLPSSILLDSGKKTSEVLLLLISYNCLDQNDCKLSCLIHIFSLLELFDQLHKQLIDLLACLGCEKLSVVLFFQEHLVDRLRYLLEEKTFPITGVINKGQFTDAFVQEDIKYESLLEVLNALSSLICATIFRNLENFIKKVLRDVLLRQTPSHNAGPQCLQ